ncbi:alanine--tRNA ligase [Candidatus Woesearchaeota archaeon]|nr:alanine--tRNA ligase [Candidatus Woesearchaeota archaeon]
MRTDKQIKAEFKKEASKNPQKYYAVSTLKKYGFERKKCDCGIYFWTTNKNQKVCGDSACSGGFQFFENNPVKKSMSFIQVWIEFAKMFKKLGYTPIKRYPLVARWRDDMEFTIASIAAFQPYIVSGEVEPPANPLVIPQFCLRFGDIDNVGITGSHMTCFNMIGQHMFVPPKDWNQERVFEDIKKWLNDGLGLPDNEITFHEDAWAGGGNFGPCMEYFSRGVELGNQVYMLFEETPNGPKDLSLKVLDMGMGMERNAWFSQATPTIYDATFPQVMKKLRERVKIKVDEQLLKKYVPLAGYLNIDEVDDITKAWSAVAKKVGVSVDTLKQVVQPNAALFSIAEHARGLLIALSDGALPSNTGGGYNLRVLARRAFSFIDKYGWNIDLAEVCKWHADELKEVFSELSENLEQVKTIIDVERKKYEQTKERGSQLVAQMIKKENITDQMLLTAYDSSGVTPDIVKEQALRVGVEVTVPDDFYAKVSAMHEQKEQAVKTGVVEQIVLPKDLPETSALYYDDYTSVEFTGKVLHSKDNYIVLDRTSFYPTSGGQLHDIGTLGGVEVVNVIKQGPIIIHQVKDDKKLKFKKGDKIKGLVDINWRKQLAQHHTSTHIVNAAARKVLGNHVYQAGAKKTEQKAHLDITHFESLPDEVLKKIEVEANIIVNTNIKVKSFFMARSDAEKKYGMKIYQGGAVPGKIIRIIDIEGVDIEACGGTHLKKTGESGKITILKSSKISDSIVRIEFSAGGAAIAFEKSKGDVLHGAAEILGVSESQVPIRAGELFEKWKKARKALKRKQSITLEELDLTTTEEFVGDALVETANILKTQPEHVPKTIERFLKDLEEFKTKLKK